MFLVVSTSVDRTQAKFEHLVHLVKKWRHQQQETRPIIENTLLSFPENQHRSSCLPGPRSSGPIRPVQSRAAPDTWPAPTAGREQSFGHDAFVTFPRRPMASGPRDHAQDRGGRDQRGTAPAGRPRALPAEPLSSRCCCQSQTPVAGLSRGGSLIFRPCIIKKISI